MAAGGDIAPTEIGHGGDAGQLGDAVGVADLHREGGIGQWAVAHGLPVRTDGVHLAAVDARAVQQAVGGRGERDPDLGIEVAQCIKRGDGAASPRAISSARIAGSQSWVRPWTKRQPPSAGNCTSAASMPSALVPDIRPR